MLHNTVVMMPKPYTAFSHLGIKALLLARLAGDAPWPLALPPGIAIAR